MSPSRRFSLLERALVIRAIALELELITGRLPALAKLDLIVVMQSRVRSLLDMLSRLFRQADPD